MFQRTTLHKLIYVCVVIAMICTTAATSASASWFISETEVSGTKALATTATVDQSFKLTAGGVTVECTGGTLNSTNPQLEGEGSAIGISASSLTFSGCSSLASTCSVTKSISTLPIKVDVGSEGAALMLATTTSKIFATIKYDGSECNLGGVQAVKGTAKAKLLGIENETTLQSFEPAATSASGELKIGSNSAELTGGALLKPAPAAAFQGCPNVCITPNNVIFTMLRLPAPFQIVNGLRVSVEIEEGKISPGTGFMVHSGELCYNKATILAGDRCQVEIEALEAGKSQVFEIKPKAITPKQAKLKS